MKIFRRNICLSDLQTEVKMLASIAWRTIFLFKKPLAILFHYTNITLPAEGYVELRNRFRIFLSNHSHDIITTIVVFCKKDYGDIEKDSIVVDIGANIGAFSLYAASQGARKVYAFEPNRAAYELLVKNIKTNNLENVIIPFKLAVTAKSQDIVSIPLSPSPYNRIQSQSTGSTSQALEGVSTISLEDILIKQNIDHLDILKVDCEGAEYDIFPAIQPAILSKITHIRMEYHAGPLAELRTYLETQGFKTIREKKEKTQSGILWFSSVSHS